MTSITESTDSLAKRHPRGGMREVFTLACPGWTSTNLQHNTGVFRALNPLFGQQCPDGALPSLYGATAPDVHGGEYFGPSRMFEMWGSPKRAVLSARARDAALARKLWTVSQELTGLAVAI